MTPMFADLANFALILILIAGVGVGVAVVLAMLINRKPW